MTMIRIIGKVVEEARIAIGKGVNCLVSIEVPGDAGAGKKPTTSSSARGTNHGGWKWELRSVLSVS